MTGPGADALDRALLDRLQAGLSLVARPFAALGEELGLAEDEVLVRLRRHEEAGLIRQIGAILDTRRLGYHSTLVAFHLPPAALDEAAALINAHPGVSHNYARAHHYNLWFTLAVPPGGDLAGEVEGLARAAGTADWLDLPALRVFKIQTHFRLAEESDSRTPADLTPGVGPDRPAAGSLDDGPPPGRDLAPAEIPMVRALQQDLPLVPRPFAALAAGAGLEEQALLETARDLQAAGILRRVGAVLRHRRVGYAANGMACWAVPEARLDQVGRLAAALPQVSHCYHRPAHPPRWPYTLFTMIHGRTPAEVETVVAGLARQTGIVDHQVLYSTHEFKKERIRYFEEQPVQG